MKEVYLLLNVVVIFQSGDVIPMPVPSSYNDITTDRTLQYFVGWVWYDREFYVSSSMKDLRLVLRVDSAHYYSMVVSKKITNGLNMEIVCLLYCPLRERPTEKVHCN